MTTDRQHRSQFLTNCGMAALMAIAFASPARATDIYSNTIDGTNPNLMDPFTDGQFFDSNLSVSGLSRGPGIGGNNANNRFNARNWSFPDFDDTDYFTWTLTPNPGYEMDFQHVYGVWRRSNTGPSLYALRSSIDGFSSDLASGSIAGASSDSDYDLDLSSLQDIGTSIEFRLYAWGGSNVAGTFSINDFIFDGEVVGTSTGGLSGDFNNDGFVDAADYTVWRNHYGEFDETSINNNGNGGDISDGDYAVWKSQYGEGAPLGSGGTSASVPVPEPAALGLVILAIGLLAASVRKRANLPN